MGCSTYPRLKVISYAYIVTAPCPLFSLVLSCETKYSADDVAVFFALAIRNLTDVVFAIFVSFHVNLDLDFVIKNNLHQFRIYLHSTCRLTWLTATKQIKASHKCFICVGEIITVVSLPYSWPILLKGFSWGFNAMLMLTMANHAALCARCWSIVTVLGRLCDHPRSVRVRCTILDQVSSVGRELLLNSMLRVRTKWSTLSRRHL